MQSTVLNGEVSVTWPDSFSLLGRDKLEKAYGKYASESWGIYTEEPKFTVTCVWAVRNPLLILLADLKANVRSQVMRSKIMFRGHDCHFGKITEGKVGDRKAQGCSMDYSREDGRYHAETIVTKTKTAIYTFTCFGRVENTERDHAAFEELIHSVRFL